MKIIIVGDGKVGSALARQLSGEGHDLTIIDSDPRVLGQSADQLDVMVVNGNGATMHTLKDAGADRADILIAATSRDELNLLTCLTAKRLGATHTIARIRNPEYADQLIEMRDELGLSLTVNPESSAAQEAYQLLQFPSFLKRESFAKGRVEIVALPVEKNSQLCGIAMHQLYDIARVNVLVCVVERGDEVYIPDGTFTLREGDTIYVTAALDSLAKLVKNLGLVDHKVKNLLIIGGSRIALQLAARCLKGGIAVKIIEQRHERAVELAELLPAATIIEADGSLQDVLEEEGIRSYDAVATLTGIDEENLVLSMLASNIGVGKVITKIDRIQYPEVFRQSEIGSVINPKDICCANIVRYVRAMSTASASDAMITLHPIADGKAEALEFRASEKTRYLDVPLKDVPLKSGILIACITHQGRTIIPRGDSRFYPDDTLIVVTSGGRTVSDLADIFAD